MNEKSFQQKMFNIIQAITGEKNLLAVPRLYIEFTGSLEGGVFLSQLIYWSDKGSRSDGFIYKTSKEWQGEIYLSDYSIRKATKLLKGMGIVETKVKKVSGNPTLHYKIDREALINRLFEFQQNQIVNSTKGNCEFNDSLTETTSEITFDKEEEQPISEVYYAQILNKKLNTKEVESIRLLVKEYSDQLVSRSIDEMVFQGVRYSLKYITKVLMDWNSRGLTTVQAVNLSMEERDAKRVKKNKQDEKKRTEAAEHKDKKESSFMRCENRDINLAHIEKQLLGWDKTEDIDG